MTKYTGTVTDADRGEIFQIKLLGGKNYIFDLRGAGGRQDLSDPLLSILGDDGEFIEDNDGGAGKNSQLAFRPDRTQYFDVAVLGNAGSTGDFILDVNIDDFRNGVIGTAPAGSADTDGQSRIGRINYDGDTDLFAVSLVAGLSYNFRMDPSSGGTNYVGDPSLALVGPGRDEIARDDNSGSEQEAFIFFKADETGDYWLRAETTDGDSGTYGVRASVGRGSQLDDELTGGESGDSINALGGDDQVSGGLGNDRIWGASGKDTLAGEDDSDRIFGGLQADQIDGGAGQDDLFGEGGRDVLDGGDGGDFLEGGDGNDVATGGTGSDTVFGESGNDRLDGGDGRDFLGGGEDRDVVAGGIGSDKVLGESGNDRLDGGDGDDFIEGGEDQDRITGGFDDDSIFGESGDDRIQGGEGDDFIDGGSENDRILGGQGADSLSGDEGDDILRGGEDTNSHHGGDGMDVFVFGSLANSSVTTPDSIDQFERAGAIEGDLIDFTGIDADRTVSGNQALVFGAGTGKGSVSLENDPAKRSTATLIHLNVDDDAEPDFTIKVFDGQSTRASDYSELDFAL